MMFLLEDSRRVLVKSRRKRRSRRRRRRDGTIPMVVEVGILRGTRSIAHATEKPLIFGQDALSE